MEIYEIYKSFASSIVSGNFFKKVSGLKSTKNAARIAEPPNNSVGSELNCVPWNEIRI